MHSITPPQSVAVRRPERDTDGLEGRRPTLDALVGKGLAVHVPGAKRTCLTEEGRQLHAHLNSTAFTPSPALPTSVLDDLVFRADDGSWQCDTPAPARQAEVELAWAAVLGQRRLHTSEQIPAPWELEQPVRAASLALEASGQQSAARDEYGRCVRAGYRVEESGRLGSPRISVKLPDSWTAVGHEDRKESAELTDFYSQNLTLYALALDRSGWTCRVIDRGYMSGSFIIAAPHKA
ncbi:hypothetical protein ACWGQT_00665 [Streptomyces yangpuensis]